MAHILNNALKNSVEKLNFGIEDLNTFLGQIHLYFSSSNADRIENIRRIRTLVGCPQVYFNNKPPTKSFSKTRWLSTGPAIEALINQWDILDIYFQMETTGKNIKTFKNFFENKFSLPLLITLRAIAAQVEEDICRIEGEGVDLMTAIKIYTELHQTIVAYKEEIVKPEVVTDIIRNWNEEDQLTFNLQLRELYDDIQSYMIQWTSWTDSLKLHLWATLDAELNENHVMQSAEAIKDSCQIDTTDLKENIEKANVFINRRLEAWASLSTSERWFDLLKNVPHLDALENAANFILTLPGNNNFVEKLNHLTYFINVGTNATIERLFSEVRHYWSDSKDSMTLATVNTVMKIRHNFERNCENVLLKLIENSELRQQVRDNSKYEEAKLKEAHSIVNLMRRYGLEEDEEEEEYMHWGEFQQHDMGSSSSDASYEDIDESSSDADDDYDEEIHSSELDRLAEEANENLFEMEVEVQDAAPDDAFDYLEHEHNYARTDRTLLEYEHNYEGPMDVESPWHR